MERECAWRRYAAEDIEALEELSQGYIEFLSQCKTERECASFALAEAERHGYRSLEGAISAKALLKGGDKVWSHAQGKALVLIQIGTEPLEAGLNIIGAHIDSPRLDLKQNPLYESNGIALLDLHYYGGIKAYQWVTLPLALHGVVVKKSGEALDIVIGESLDDPVFCVTDLLIHLARKQMEKKASEVIEGEDLDLLVGNRPLVVPEAAPGAEGAPAAAGAPAAGAPAAAEAAAAGKRAELAKKEPVKAYLLDLLAKTYGFEEEDFLSAELEVVPAGRARECGFDRSMVLGYGQDDRACAYTALAAQLAQENPRKTSVCILVDKEEIGSVGATGMASHLFESTIAEIVALTVPAASTNAAGPAPATPSDLVVRRALAASSMLSSDVSAAFDPAYAEVFEAKNSAYLGRGLVFSKYTGSRGKSGSNDASAEYLSRIRAIMDGAQVSFQTAELGRVDAGGGGTIAYIPAAFGMDVIDAGVPVLSMHSPWEVTSKADLYEAYKGYQAFLREA